MKLRHNALASVAILSCIGMVALTRPSRADVIPYATPGTVNTATYSFTASNTGDVIAYFAGTGAAYDNQLGLLVNGVSTGLIGLDNHSSSIGQSFDLGHANAGDVLTFVLQNNTLGTSAYSDPALNLSYDTTGYTGSHQHIYSTAYTATSPKLGSIPTGLYVGFEDQVFPRSDYNYTDETFVFTNVSSASSTGVPEPASLLVLGTGLVGLLASRRRVPR